MSTSSSRKRAVRWGGSVSRDCCGTWGSWACPRDASGTPPTARTAGPSPPTCSSVTSRPTIQTSGGPPTSPSSGTWEGWLYLAVVLDLYARRVVGWAVQPHLQAELALEALQLALGRRVPAPGLVHHSDRGCQYAAEAYQRVLREHGIVCSMSRTGDCWDNAVTESFFATLKTELIHRQPWPTRRAATDAVADYIEGFYNPYRLHSSLGYLSPNAFERRHVRNVTCAA